jgi:hypothetical protein
VWNYILNYLVGEARDKVALAEGLDNGERENKYRELLEHYGVSEIE